MTTKNLRTAPQTREELLAALAAHDKADEVASLKAQIAELTSTVTTLTAERRSLSMRLSEQTTVLENIRKLLGPSERRSRMSAYDAAAQVPVSVNSPASNPVSAAQPVRTMAAGSKAVTDTELAALFPETAGPTVGGTEN